MIIVNSFTCISHEKIVLFGGEGSWVAELPGTWCTGRGNTPDAAILDLIDGLARLGARAATEKHNAARTSLKCADVLPAQDGLP